MCFSDDGKYQIFQYHLNKQTVVASQSYRCHELDNSRYRRKIVRTQEAHCPLPSKKERFEKWIPLIPDQIVGNVVNIVKHRKREKIDRNRVRDVCEMYRVGGRLIPKKLQYGNIINHKDYLITIRFDNLFVHEKSYNNDNIVTKEKKYNFEITTDDIRRYDHVFDWARVGYANNVKNYVNDGLYKISGASEVELMAEYLMNLLININWLVAFDISSFCVEKWQRNVYFNCQYVEKLIKEKYAKSLQQQKQQHDEQQQKKKGKNKCGKTTTKTKAKEKTTKKTTTDKDIPSELTTLTRDDIFEIVDNPLSDICETYQDDIVSLAKRDQLCFPDSRECHGLYTRQAKISSIHENELFGMNKNDLYDCL